jgi:spore germination cell wall hydrolase CwlJ-like protein
MTFTSALICLSLTIYFEARNQPLEGQVAVAQVVLNRVMDDRYPDKVCDVVMQSRKYKDSGHPVKWSCQFSFYCDGKTDTPTDIDAYRWAKPHCFRSSLWRVAEFCTRFNSLSYGLC